MHKDSERHTYERARQDTLRTWDVASLDDSTGDDYYDEATNTVRLVYPDGWKCRTFLVHTGVFTEPDANIHRILHLRASDKKSPDPESVVSGLGILINVARFKEWKVKGKSMPGPLISSNSEAQYATDVVIAGGPHGGISVRADGSIAIVAQGSEIVLGKDGIVMSGVTHRWDPETRAGIMKSNPLRQFAIPSFCVVPVASELPDLRLITGLGSLVSSLGDI